MFCWKRKPVVPPQVTKASEYAALCSHKPPSFAFGDVKIASVTHQGHLSFYDLNRHTVLTPAEALSFACWIVATFGEPIVEEPKT